MKLLSPLLCLTLLSGAALAATETKVYKKVTKQGTVIYSDQPLEGAQEIIIKSSVQTPLPTLQQRSRGDDSRAADPAAFEGEIIIDAPSEEQTIRDSQGNFTVLAQIKPALPAGHRLQLFVNDNPWGEATEATVFKLSNIDRGQTRLRIDLQDKTGQKIASSNTRTFYLHRTFTN